jgi:prepilin-type N-terminal cleavage/methylation domain-containing protein
MAMLLKNIHNGKKLGFTLVEVMLVAVLLSILLGSIFAVLNTGRISMSAGETQLTIQQECRRGLNSMVKELRQSSSLKITDVPANGVNYTSITFQIPANISMNSTTWSSSIQYSLGGLNGTQLIRTQPGAQRILANYISSVIFTRSASTPNLLNVRVNARKNTFAGFTARQSDITLFSKIKLRN